LVVENLDEEFRLCGDLWLYFNSIEEFLTDGGNRYLLYPRTSVSRLLWHGWCTLELLIRTSTRQFCSGAHPKVRRYSSFYYSVLVAVTLYTFSTLFTVRSRAAITFVGGAKLIRIQRKQTHSSLSIHITLTPDHWWWQQLDVEERSRCSYQKLINFCFHYDIP